MFASRHLLLFCFFTALCTNAAKNANGRACEMSSLAKTPGLQRNAQTFHPARELASRAEPAGLASGSGEPAGSARLANPARHPSLTPEVWKDVTKAKKQNNGVDKFVPDFKRLLPKIFENSQRDVIRIIELGSFKGHSTVEMAKECQKLAKESDKKCQIVAVDTWLASPEHYESEGKEISQETLVLPLLDKRRYNPAQYNEIAAVFVDIQVPKRSTSSMDEKQLVYQAQYTRHIIVECETFNPILRAGKLFHQFLVDSYMSTEQERLLSIQSNQTKLYAEEERPVSWVFK
ncbi:hypothetical protein L596_029760 [Steinernema carpocapsae]|uniref:Uncharacterized protein n=1 Tax=Steinernema carpocapsae TaxID=34508 RepID=A0A4U5LQR3_STECR|nr:hypothetical protein L596_029760 [Steinernema carpocapsae]